MDTRCEYLNNLLVKCLYINYEVFGEERGRVMCDHIKKLIYDNCKDN